MRVSDPRQLADDALWDEPGWERIDPLSIEGGRGTFVTGDPEGDRLRVRYYRRQADGCLVGKAWFGRGALGPPGHAHGGSMAAVLDEVMGATAWLAGHRVVAVSLTSDFRRMLPLGTLAWFSGEVVEVDGRKVHTRGRLTDRAGEPFATARGLFLELDPERFAELLAHVRSGCSD